MRAVTLLSGGLDSTTLAYLLKDSGYDLTCLSFDYGQRHVKELEVAIDLADVLGAKHHLIKIRTPKWVPAISIQDSKGAEVANAEDLMDLPLAAVLGDSVLVNPDKEVPDGHYADENMKQTVVPNRNAIMLSIAYGIAMAENAEVVAFAAHAGDHAIYPDCRPAFVNALEHAFTTGARWNPEDLVPHVSAPFLGLSKADIVKTGAELKVPFEQT
jgi:7-cyano-7-deazaguanine synthase